MSLLGDLLVLQPQPALLLLWLFVELAGNLLDHTTGFYLADGAVAAYATVLYCTQASFMRKPCDSSSHTAEIFGLAILEYIYLSSWPCFMSDLDLCYFTCTLGFVSQWICQLCPRILVSFNQKCFPAIYNFWNSGQPCPLLNKLSSSESI